ncbi:MAG: RnfABCDGE type electron transport complex subunit D, partial [Candidatus Mariimomonas ferrooxydans]
MAGEKEHPLIVSISPHVTGEESVSRIMWTVNLALLPAFIVSVYYFGPRALFVTGLCILTSVLSEYIFQKGLKKRISINDGSAFLTGLLLGMNLPPGLPFYIPVVGSFVAIVIAKLLFGGLGYNIFNPALIGRAFLLVSWPRAMTIWSEPTALFVGLDAKTPPHYLNHHSRPATPHYLNHHS